MLLQIGYYLLGSLGIVKRNSKILSFMMVAMMWVVFGLCTYNGDFNNYNFIYDNIQNPVYWGEFEPLYNVLMYICSILGLSFIQFRMVLGGIYVISLYIASSKYTENTAEVLGFYMLFPFLSFTSIVRSGLAAVFVVLAYYEVLNGKNNKTKFWIYFIVAVLIHYTSVFFIIYYYLRKKEFRRTRGLIIMGLIIAVLVAFYSGLLYYAMSLITDSQRILNWFVPNTESQKLRWTFYLIVINIALIFLAYLPYSRNINSSSHIFNPYADEIYHLSISMMVFIPTFFVSNASARLMWQNLLFHFVCYAKDDESFSPRRHKQWKISRNTAILVVFLLFLAYYANLPYRGTVNDGYLIFRNNLLYNWNAVS